MWNKTKEYGNTAINKYKDVSNTVKNWNKDVTDAVSDFYKGKDFIVQTAKLLAPLGLAAGAAHAGAIHAQPQGR